MQLLEARIRKVASRDSVEPSAEQQLNFMSASNGKQNKDSKVSSEQQHPRAHRYSLQLADSEEDDDDDNDDSDRRMNHLRNI
jgi:hypothetical protein